MNYCQQQLKKKKLFRNSPKEKMGYLMKNFSKLETYFDLPQLISQLNVLKIHEENLKNVLPRSTKKLISDAT